MLVGKVEREGVEHNPDLEPALQTSDFRTIALETVVRMKLNAFRRKDQVHLLDMISPGIIGAAWLDRFPDQLQLRLDELLNDSDS